MAIDIFDTATQKKLLGDSWIDPFANKQTGSSGSDSGEAPGWLETAANRAEIGLKNVGGSFLTSLGVFNNEADKAENLASIAEEYGMPGEKVEYLREQARKPPDPNSSSQRMIRTGQQLTNEASELSRKYGTPKELAEASLWDNATNPDFWTDPRGAMGMAVEGAASSLPFIATSFLFPEIGVPTTVLRGAAAVANPAIRKAANFLLDKGVGTYLDKTAAGGIFNAGLDAATNAGEIYQPLHERGMADREIAGRMGDAITEELPYDIASNILFGGLATGQLGKLIAGPNAGMARRGLSGAASGLVDSGVEGAQEVKQTQITNKYTDRPYGSLLDILPGRTLLPEEQAAFNAGFFGNAPVSAAGTVRDMVRPPRDDQGGGQGGNPPQAGQSTANDIPQSREYTISDQVSNANITDLTDMKIRLLDRDYFNKYGRHLYITSMKREGNPNDSWHNTGQAIDTADDLLASNAEAREWLMERARQYKLTPLDEYTNPSPHATGGHIHFSDHGEELSGVGSLGSGETGEIGGQREGYTSRAEGFDMRKDMANAVSRILKEKYGLDVPAWIPYGINIQEAGWNLSPLAKTHNNLSGIKFVGQETATEGEISPEGDPYARYDSIEGYAEDFARVLALPRYAGLDKAKNGADVARILKDGGYFTGSDVEGYGNGVDDARKDFMDAGGESVSTRSKSQPVNAPRVDINFDDENSAETIEDFAKSRRDSEEWKDYFSSFFDEDGNFENTKENRDAIREDFGEELQEFADSRAPSPRQMVRMMAQEAAEAGDAARYQQLQSMIESNDVVGMARAVVPWLQRMNESQAPRTDPRASLLQRLVNAAAQGREQKGEDYVKLWQNLLAQQEQQQAQSEAEELGRRLFPVSEGGEQGAGSGIGANPDANAGMMQEQRAQREAVQRQAEEQAAQEQAAQAAARQLWQNANMGEQGAGSGIFNFGVQQTQQPVQQQGARQAGQAPQPAGQGMPSGRAAAEQRTQPANPPRPANVGNTSGASVGQRRGGTSSAVQSLYANEGQEQGASSGVAANATDGQTTRTVKELRSIVNDVRQGRISPQEGIERVQNTVRAFADANSGSSLPVEVVESEGRKAIADIRKIAESRNQKRGTNNEESTTETTGETGEAVNPVNPNGRREDTGNQGQDTEPGQTEEVGPEVAQNAQEGAQATEGGRGTQTPTGEENASQKGAQEESGQSTEETSGAEENPTQQVGKEASESTEGTVGERGQSAQKQEQTTQNEEGQSRETESEDTEELSEGQIRSRLSKLRKARQQDIDSMVEHMNANPGGKGVNSQLVQDNDGNTKRITDSNNPEWYQRAYKLYGGKPPKKAYPSIAEKLLADEQGFSEREHEIERLENALRGMKESGGKKARVPKSKFKGGGEARRGPFIVGKRGGRFTAVWDMWNDGKYQKDAMDWLMRACPALGGTYKDGVFSFKSEDAFEEFLDAGYAMADTIISLGEEAKMMGQGQRNRLLEALKKTKVVRKDQLTSQQSMLSALGESMGCRIVWIDGADNLRGIHNKNVTFLNHDSNIDLKTVFWHEQFHWIKANNTRLYRKLLKFFGNSFTEKQIADYKKRVDRPDLSHDVAIEEMLADNFEHVVERNAMLQQLAKEKPSLARRFVAWLKRMVDRFAEMFHNPQGRMTTAQRDAFVEGFGKIAKELKDGKGNPLFKVQNKGKAVTLANGDSLLGQLLDMVKDPLADISGLRLMTAWHGSPHKFVKFLLSAIGSGEGAQVHGWGLYFAKLREVAEGYRRRLAGTQPNLESVTIDGEEYIQQKNGRWQKQNGEPIEINSPLDIALRELEYTSGDIFDATGELGKLAMRRKERSLLYRNAIDIIVDGKVDVKKNQPPGSLLQVEIPEDDVMLDEQKTLAEQPEKVKKALKELCKREKMTADPNGNMILHPFKAKMTGWMIYRELETVCGNAKNASELLNKYGIKGITYVGEQDGRCYVVFDDDAIEITARFSFVGENSQTARHDLLERAKKMEKGKKGKQSIFRETGWFKGKDEKWRYEIPDHLDKMDFEDIEGGMVATLDEVYNNPELFKAYPQLANVEVRAKELDGAMGMAQATGDPKNGEFSITLDLKTLRKDLRESQKTVVHELTHSIQYIEDYATGGTEETVRQQIGREVLRLASKLSAQSKKEGVSDLLQRYRAIQKTMAKRDGLKASAQRTALQKEVDALRADVKKIKGQLPKELVKEVDNTNSKLEQYTKILQGKEDDFNLYMRLAGEQEARAAENRAEVMQDARDMVSEAEEALNNLLEGATDEQREAYEERKKIPVEGMTEEQRDRGDALDKAMGPDLSMAFYDLYDAQEELAELQGKVPEIHGDDAIIVYSGNDISMAKTEEKTSEKQEKTIVDEKRKAGDNKKGAINVPSLSDKKKTELFVDIERHIDEYIKEQQAAKNDMNEVLADMTSENPAHRERLFGHVRSLLHDLDVHKNDASMKRMRVGKLKHVEDIDSLGQDVIDAAYDKIIEYLQGVLDYGGVLYREIAMDRRGNNGLRSEVVSWESAENQRAKREAEAREAERKKRVASDNRTSESSNDTEGSSARFSFGPSSNSRQSFLKRIANLLAGRTEQKARYRRVLTEMLQDALGVKIRYGHKVDNGVVYDDKNKTIRSRHAYDWDNILPVAGEVIAKRLNLNATEEMKNYISNWIQTGALNNTSQEARDFQQAMRNNPHMAEKLQDLQAKFKEWNNLDNTTQVESVFEWAKPSNINWRNLKSKAYDQLFEELAPVERLVESITKTTGKLKSTIDPVKKFRLYRGYYGIVETMIHGKGEDAVNGLRNVLPGVDWTGFKTMRTILESVGAFQDKAQQRHFASYCAAKHIKDIHERNRKMEQDKAATEAKVETFEQEIQQTEADIQTMKDDMKARRKAKGINQRDVDVILKLEREITKAERKVKRLNARKKKAEADIEKMVPMETPMTEKQCDEYIREWGSKFDQAQQDMVKFSNTTAQILYDSGYISEARYKKLVKTWPNYCPLFRVFDDNSDVGFGDSLAKLDGSTRDIINPLESIIRNTHLFVQKAMKNRAKLSLADVARLDGSGWLISEVETSKPNDETTIVFYEDGKKKYLETDPSIVEAVNNMGIANADWFSKVLYGILKFAKTCMTMAKPEFAVSNMFRDIESANVLSQHGFVSPFGFIRGIIHALTKDDVYYEWLAAGGAQASIFSLDRDYTQETLNQMERSWKGRLLNPKTFIPAIYEFLQIAGEYSEYGTRIAVYKNTKKALEKQRGAALENILDAAFESRDIMDFARSGKAGRAWNRWAVFSNAALQDWNKFYRTFNFRENPKRATRAVARLFFWSVLPTVFFFAMNHDKDWFKQLKDYQRDNNWFFELGDTKYRIPKSQDIGIHFTSGILERLLDWGVNHESKGIKDFLKLVNEMLPSIAPTVAMPLIEAMANHSFFTESPIVPKRQEGEEPRRQYGPYSTSFAKWFGEKFDIAPYKVDHVITGYSGDAVNMWLKGYEVLSGDRQLDTSVEEMPFTRRLTVMPYKSAKVVDEYYDALDEQTRKEKTFKETKTQPDGFDPALLKRLKGVQKQMSELNKKERAAIDNKNLSIEQRKNMQIAINKQRIALAERALLKK